MGREDEIKLIAYSIWEEEGCPDGRDCEYWFRAETVWEANQKPESEMKNTRKTTKQPVKQPAKVMPARKK
jgi:hypothetical protein